MELDTEDGEDCCERRHSVASNGDEDGTRDDGTGTEDQWDPWSDGKAEHIHADHS